MTVQRVSSYQRIFDHLAEKIRREELPNGQLVLEGGLASFFHTSRGPVRQALKELVNQGLMVKAEGRGYMVVLPGEAVPASPVRKKITAEMLGSHNGGNAMPVQESAAASIYGDVEQAVTLCIPFGHYRIIETSLCEFHHVSRTVGREVLQRLQQRGLIEKSMQSHWLAGPITAHDVSQEYELRLFLEPEALRMAAPYLERKALIKMQDDLQACLENPSMRTLEAVERLENALHNDCITPARNLKLLNVLDQCRLPLVVNHVFYDTLKNTELQKLFWEHKLVLDHLVAGSVDAAAGALKAHLLEASRRTRARLKVLSVFPEPNLPPYLKRIV